MGVSCSPYTVFLGGLVCFSEVDFPFHALTSQVTSVHQSLQDPWVIETHVHGQSLVLLGWTEPLMTKVLAMHRWWDLPDGQKPGWALPQLPLSCQCWPRCCSFWRKIEVTSNSQGSSSFPLFNSKRQGCDSCCMLMVGVRCERPKCSSQDPLSACLEKGEREGTNTENFHYPTSYRFPAPTSV